MKEKRYLLSNGRFTTDKSTYIADYIEVTFKTERFSIPTFDFGFEHSLRGIKGDEIRTKLEYRIDNTLKQLNSLLSLDLKLKSVTWDENVNNRITIELSGIDNGNKISINL